MKKAAQNWKVVLGEAQAQRYTRASAEEQGLRVLGCVSRGGQFGALAQAPDGRYVQVNGDHITPLSQGQIGRAVRLASAAPAHDKTAPRRESAMARASSPPVVIVKRRRVIERPDKDRPNSR